jgi:hypothetical protein
LEFKWIRAKNLKKEDVLVVGKDIYSQGEIPKIPKIDKSSKDRYSIPINITKEFVQICGLIIGDGNISKDKVSFCLPKNDLVRLNYEKILEKLFCVKPSKYEQTITCCSKAIVELFTHFELDVNHNSIKILNNQKTMQDFITIIFKY